MQNKIIKLLTLSFIAFYILGCNSETLEPDANRSGLSYFPLSTGLYKTYEVEQINYRVTGVVDTTRYQLKESIVDSFTNVNNNFTYILHRFSKSPDQEQWKLDSVWNARRTPRQAIVVENNIPFVKLIFPLKEMAEWDGNSSNALEEEAYTMVEVNKPFRWRELDYDQSTTVIQKDNQDSIIFLDQRKEVYAQDLGLIFKESVALKFCSQVQCIGKGEIESGTIYRQYIIENGKE